MIIVHNSFDKREEIEEGGMHDCSNLKTINFITMTLEEQQIAAANRIANTSPMIGNEKLVAIQNILPKHYLVQKSKSNLKGSIHCKSLIDKGLTGKEWEEFKPKAKKIVGDGFLEFFHNTCINHLDFTIYAK
jgi:hypothetical protein